MRVAFLALGLLTACTASTVGTGSSSGNSGVDSNQPTQSGGTTAQLPSAGDSNVDTGGTSEFDALFDAPSSSSTTDTVKGLWAGSFGYNRADVRLKIESGRITAAIRCSTGHTAGVAVTAKASDTSIRVLESKSSSNGSCTVQFRPVTIEKCATNEYDCFDLADGTLRFGAALFEDQVTAPDPSFTKLSD